MPPTVTSPLDCWESSVVTLSIIVFCTYLFVITSGILINKQNINTDKKTNILRKFLITLHFIYINEQNYKKNSIYERANHKK